jgi:hypothetical protein
VSVRGEIRELLARARRARREDHAVPIVASPEEAARLAAGIAAQLAGASPEEKLLCLAALEEIDAALETSTARARAGMAETARQLADARRGAAACLGYAAASRPGARIN